MAHREDESKKITFSGSVAGYEEMFRWNLESVTAMKEFCAVRLSLWDSGTAVRPILSNRPASSHRGL